MSDIADDLRAAIETSEKVIAEDPVASEPAKEEPAKQEASRSDDGKFAPKTPAINEAEAKAPAAEAVVEGATTPAPVPAPAAPASRAPITWKPEVREEWEKVPPAVQAEVARREREIDTTLRQTAEVRRFAEQFGNVIAPYETMLRAENAHPLAAMGELFKTASVLRTAPAPERAARVADLIMQFGIDFNLLDEALAQRVQGGQSRQQAQQPDVAALVQQELAKHATTQMSSSAAQTWQEFAGAPENEFAIDLREDIADLLEMAARRGQTLSLSDAYRRATLVHPTISGIVSNRQQKQSAAQQTAAARRAKDAAASVSSGGAPSRGGEAEDVSDIRSAMQASIRELSNAR